MSTFKFRRVFLTGVFAISLIDAGFLATTSTGFAQTRLAKPPAASTSTPKPNATATTSQVIQSATIINFSGPAQAGQLMIGLGIDFLYGRTLLGSELNAILAEGVLEVTLPDGRVKSLPGIPPADPKMAGMSFQKLDPKAKDGISIAVYLGKALGKTAQGKYQVIWRSRNVVTPATILNWDGHSVTFEEPYVAVDASEYLVELEGSLKILVADTAGNVIQINGTIKRLAIDGTAIKLTSNKFLQEGNTAYIVTQDLGKIKVTMTSNAQVTIWLTASQRSKLKTITG